MVCTKRCLSDLVVRESQVYKLLKSLDISKATGPDNISGKILKECAREIEVYVKFLMFL